MDFSHVFSYVAVGTGCSGVCYFCYRYCTAQSDRPQFCGLWGVLSFSVSGFTFPVPAMPQLMQLMSDLFPMRHYYLLYVDQALNGIPMAYSWKPYLALVLFVLLPLLTLPKLKLDLQENRYLP